jgi:mRNA-degrading endonuclease RelE of RelBE toxin-antitoxin system
MDYKETEEFIKEFKKLSKKYRTIESDFELLKKIILKFPEGGETRHAVSLKKSEEICIIKRRMMCRSTQGQNFRVIYAYIQNEVRILFIECYFKGKKETEDNERIEKYWKELNN